MSDFYLLLQGICGFCMVLRNLLRRILLLPQDVYLREGESPELWKDLGIRTIRHGTSNIGGRPSIRILQRERNCRGEDWFYNQCCIRHLRKVRFTIIKIHPLLWSGSLKLSFSVSTGKNALSLWSQLSLNFWILST